MMIFKGTLYGMLGFVIFGLYYFFTKFPISTNRAISLRTLQYLTVNNFWFWTVLVLMVATGCACQRLLAEIRN